MSPVNLNLFNTPGVDSISTSSMFGALICLGVALNSNFALTLTIGLTILVYLLKGWEGGITIPLLTLDSFSLFLILLSVFVT